MVHVFILKLFLDTLHIQNLELQKWLGMNHFHSDLSIDVFMDKVRQDVFPKSRVTCCLSVILIFQCIFISTTNEIFRNLTPKVYNF